LGQRYIELPCRAIRGLSPVPVDSSRYLMKFPRPTRLQRITLILFVLTATHWIMRSTTGYSIIGGEVLTGFFLIFLVLFALSCLWPWGRKILLGKRLKTPE
jgi:hypothetical protein